jgi:hypothetical protein
MNIFKLQLKIIYQLRERSRNQTGYVNTNRPISNSEEIRGKRISFDDKHSYN